MGEVYRAHVDGVAGFRKTVAVKRIYPDLAMDADYRKMFIREAKLAAALTHPNIVQVLELGESSDELYIAMEFVHGVDLALLLRKLAKRGERLTSPLIALIIFDLASALEYAHGQTGAKGEAEGIVHSDVSPQNILISTDGFVKLCDFGIAKATRSVTAPHKLRGKLPYVAPELLLGQRGEIPSDIFSLGVVAYEMAAGSRMFAIKPPATQLKWLRSGVKNPILEGLVQPADEILDPAIAPAVALKPEERYSSAAQFRNAVEDYLVTSSPGSARAALATLVKEFSPNIEPSTGWGDSTSTQTGRVVTAAQWTSILERAPERKAENLPPTMAVSVTQLYEARGMRRTYESIRGRSIDFYGGLQEYFGRFRGKPFRHARQFTLVLMALVALGLASLPLLKREAPSTPQQSPTPKSIFDELGDLDLVPPLEPVTQVPIDDREPSNEAQQNAKNRGRRGKRAARVGFLNLSSKPSAQVFINGRRIKRATPLSNYPLPTGDHSVRLESPRGKVKTLRIHIKAQQTVSHEINMR